MKVKEPSDKQRRSKENGRGESMRIGSEQSLRNVVGSERAEDDSPSDQEESRKVPAPGRPSTPSEGVTFCSLGYDSHEAVSEDVCKDRCSDVEPSVGIQISEGGESCTKGKPDFHPLSWSCQAPFALRYSEQMILTTSGIVAILRAFLSSSKSRSISGVMATVIFGVGFFGVLFTRVRWHKKVYNGIGGIGWQ